MSVKAASASLLILCIAVIVPLYNSQDCPAIDARCSCITSFISQSIVCQRLDYVDLVPQFDRSTTVYESLTIKDFTIVRRVQANAFEGLRLNRLDLQALSIETIDVDSFVGLDTSQLYEIHLCDNYIDNVPEGTFRNMSSLSILGLQHNGIKQLDTGLFHGLSSLSYLHLEGNRLNSLPDTLLRQLGMLRDLSLFANDLSEISTTALQGLTNLQKLELNGNQLRRVTVGAFRLLSRLRELQLQDNQLGPVLNKSMFEGLVQLETIDISNNLFNRLLSDTFVYTPRLRNVYILSLIHI